MIGASTLFSQQASQYSQYRYSLFVINPAYAGNKNNIQGMLSERKQWIGINGSPHSQALAFHAPFKNQKMGFGVNLYNETIGAHGTIGGFGSYSYSIKSPSSSLSFGIRAGFFSYRILSSSLSYRQGSDPSALNELQTNILPAFDFGMHYYNKRFMGGFSITNLTESDLKFVTDNIVRNSLKRHLFGYLGYIFNLSDTWQFQSTVMTKYTLNAPVNIDLNTMFICQSKFGFGLSYRSNQAVVAMVQMWFAQNFRLGYSYDYEFKLTQNTNISGSHELFFGFDLNKKNAAVVNPRFL